MCLYLCMCTLTHMCEWTCAGTHGGQEKDSDSPGSRITQVAGSCPVCVLAAEFWPFVRATSTLSLKANSTVQHVFY